MGMSPSAGGGGGAGSSGGRHGGGGAVAGALPPSGDGGSCEAAGDGGKRKGKMRALRKPGSWRMPMRGCVGGQGGGRREWHRGAVSKSFAVNVTVNRTQ